MTAREFSARARVLPVRDHPAFVFGVSALLAAVLFVPYLGSVGLWDPWETHYSEVGREMLARGDFIHPHWEASWFFSKPVLTLWLAAFGLFMAGANGTSGELPPYTEWAIRLPFAVLSMLAIAVLAHHVSRLTSKRVGLLSGLVLATSPMWFFVSRQAMTDMPFVASATISTSCFLRVMLDASATRRWLDLAWAAAGVATLGKGLLGLGLPIATIGVLMLAEARNPREVWASVRAVTPLRGLVLFVAIAFPWYVAMLRFDGVDNEGKTFFQRFFLHDHFARLTTGVFTTTPGGTFTYFIEQGAYGFFPWVGVLPLALGRMLRGGEVSSRVRLERAMLCWSLFSFGLFTFSATKFHHYCLPMLPGLAVLVALALDEVLAGTSRSAPMLVVGGVLLGFVGRDLAQAPRRWIELFTYNHERPYPDVIDGWPIFSGAPAWLNAHTSTWLVTAACVAVLGLLAHERASLKLSPTRLIGALLVSALFSSLWLSWSHWVDMSHQWTQRDLFWRYFRNREASEPIAAFYMDWKGETFYSRNTVLQLGPANWQKDLPAFLGRPGRKWVLVEHARLQFLTQAIGPSHTMKSIEPGLNNKFVLVLVDA